MEKQSAGKTSPHPKPLFALGQVVATPGALGAIIAEGENPFTYLAKHQSGDWSEMCQEDQAENRTAIRYEDDPERRGRVLSAYHTPKGVKVWVITEHDRSVTTILLPNEY
jgi:hypothetical protein